MTIHRKSPGSRASKGVPKRQIPITPGEKKKAVPPVVPTKLAKSRRERSSAGAWMVDGKKKDVGFPTSEGPLDPRTMHEPRRKKGKP